MTILEKIKLDEILENVFDKRLSPLEKLSVLQLREEYLFNNLDKSGTKAVLVQHLQMVLGQDAKVFFDQHTGILQICYIHLHFFEKHIVFFLVDWLEKEQGKRDWLQNFPWCSCFEGANLKAQKQKRKT